MRRCSDELNACQWIERDLAFETFDLRKAIERDLKIGKERDFETGDFERGAG